MAHANTSVCVSLYCFELRTTHVNTVAKKKKQKKKATPRPIATEDRRAEVATVAWMLSMTATLGAEVVGGLVLATFAFAGPAQPPLSLFPDLMLFAAGVTGCVCLCLTPLVYRLRRRPPPTSITALAITVSVVPLAIGTFQIIQ